MQQRAARAYASMSLPHLACAVLIALSLASTAHGSSSNFRPATYSTGGPTPLGLATADFDGDGSWDVAAADWSVHLVTVSLNDGTGHIGGVSYTLATPHNPWSVVAAQLVGDDRPDLAVACRGAMGDSAFYVSVFENVDGLLTNRTDYDLGFATQPRWVTAGDLDGDGLTDLVVALWNANAVSVLLNLGSGAFSAPATYAVGRNPRCVAMADLDDDGDLDLAVTNEAGNSVCFLRNTGGGVFAAAVTYGGFSFPQGIEPVDLDRDGDVDLAVANQVPVFGSVRVSVLRNTGTSGFTGPLHYAVGPGALQGIASFDANQDGAPDLVVANGFLDQVLLLVNQGNGALALAQKVQLASGSDPHWFAVHDFDGGPNWNDDVAVSSLQGPADSSLVVLLSRAQRTSGGPSPGRPVIASTSVPDGGHPRDAVVRVYDIRGRLCASLPARDAAPHALAGRGLDPGVYLLRSTSGDVLPRRLVVPR